MCKSVFSFSRPQVRSCFIVPMKNKAMEENKYTLCFFCTWFILCFFLLNIYFGWRSIFNFDLFESLFLTRFYWTRETQRCELRYSVIWRRLMFFFIGHIYHRWYVYERASAASEWSVFNIMKKSQHERPGPAWNAFERLISQPLRDRFTCGNFCRVGSSLLPTTGQLSMHVGDP